MVVAVALALAFCFWDVAAMGIFAATPSTLACELASVFDVVVHCVQFKRKQIKN